MKAPTKVGIFRECCPQSPQNPINLKGLKLKRAQSVLRKQSAFLSTTLNAAQLVGPAPRGARFTPGVRLWGTPIIRISPSAHPVPVTALLALGALSGALGAATAASGYSGILYLLLCFTCAAFYLLCAGAGFLGYAYLLVYVGAIAILFLFANMLSVRSSGRTPSS